jgi:phosphopantothenoylcysteine decarboxylase/phosphopantothenate--cysteine ligase
MGYAVAEAARDRGAQVTLISGPVELQRPAGVEFVQIGTAEELSHAVDEHLGKAQVLVMAAAVADQRPARRAEQATRA